VYEHEEERARQEVRQEIRDQLMFVSDRINDIVTQQGQILNQAQIAHSEQLRMHEENRGQMTTLATNLAAHVAAPGHDMTIRRLDNLETRVNKLEDGSIASKAKTGAILAMGAAIWTAIVFLKDEIVNFLTQFARPPHP